MSVQLVNLLKLGLQVVHLAKVNATLVKTWQHNAYHVILLSLDFFLHHFLHVIVKLIIMKFQIILFVGNATIIARIAQRLDPQLVCLAFKI